MLANFFKILELKYFYPQTIETLKVFTIPLSIIGIAVRLTSKSPLFTYPLSFAILFICSTVLSVLSKLS